MFITLILVLIIMLIISKTSNALKRSHRSLLLSPSLSKLKSISLSKLPLYSTKVPKFTEEADAKYFEFSKLENDIYLWYYNIIIIIIFIYL